MTATDLLPPTQQLRPGAAARWVRACVAEAEALQDFDADLLPVDDSPAAESRAAQLRAAWTRWADEAETLLNRVGDDPSLAPFDRQKLGAMVRLTRALVRQDPAELRRRQQRVESGDFVTREEARRELGLPHRR